MSELKPDADASRYSLGLLFTDGMPELDENSGYRGAVAARAAGISYRQLDYWARTGLVEPTVRGAAGSGSQRLYGFRDILVLKLVKRLLDTGISLQQIRTAVNQLRESGISDLAQTTLMSDGATVARVIVKRWHAVGEQQPQGIPRGVSVRLELTHGLPFGGYVMRYCRGTEVVRVTHGKWWNWWCDNVLLWIALPTVSRRSASRRDIRSTDLPCRSNAV